MHVFGLNPKNHGIFHKKEGFDSGFHRVLSDLQSTSFDMPCERLPAASLTPSAECRPP